MRKKETTDEKQHTMFVMTAAAEVVDKRHSVCQTLQCRVKKASVAEVCQSSTDTQRRRPIKGNTFRCAENTSRQRDSIFAVNYSAAVCSAILH